MSRVDNSRTTAGGLHRYGKEFAAAAIVVARHKQQGKFSTVAYHLASHSIELALKAFLRARGASLSDLRRHDVRHDLVELLERAEGRGLSRIIKLEPLAYDQIRCLNEHHSAHRFRYIETGSFEVPEWQDVEIIMTCLLAGLSTFCIRNTVGRVEAMAMEKAMTLGADSDSAPTVVAE